jgi:hypothetical protein
MIKHLSPAPVLFIFEKTFFEKSHEFNLHQHNQSTFFFALRNRGMLIKKIAFFVNFKS